MNLTSSDPTAPPPPPPQPPRSSFSCDRHPTEQFTGFCPTCLCERLTTLDNSSSNTPSASRRPSSVSAAIKSLFASSKPNDSAPPPPPQQQPDKCSKPTSFFPELRRTKSFSASKNEALSLSCEPQRRSCDVRVARNTLWSLFSQDDENKTVGGANSVKPSASSVSASASASSSLYHQNNPSNPKQIETSFVNKPVFEENENEEEFKDPEYVANGVIGFVDDDSDDGDEIKPVPDFVFPENLVKVEVNSGEIVEEEVAVDVSNNMKPMKDHIDMDTQNGKKSVGGGGFWSAASVFSKKWNNWRRKQKNKKQNNDGNSTTLPVEKPISRQYRETQSEIADYGYGRRSCDIDPRFSLDAGRISFDDPRYSFDEHRASWDGHVIGRRSFSRMAAPPMVSVMEDAPASAVHVPRIDMQIPVDNSFNEDESVPGGSVQTREYYLDTSSKRRKSLDRSSSIRKTAASVVADMDEFKTVSNPKVSATNVDYFDGVKVLVGERDSRDSNSNLRDDCSEALELGGGFRDSSMIENNGERKELKKSKRWSWIWGFIHRRNGGSNKDGDEDEKYGRVNGVERSLSESWPGLRRELHGDMKNGFNRNMFRSNSSVSWRNANHFGGSFESARKSNVETSAHGRIRDEFVLERNRSARYSPNHFGGSFESARKSNVEMNGHGRNRDEFVLERNRSARYSPNHFGGSFESARKSNVETTGNGRNRDEFVLERNRSARYSPNQHVDNGLLRFYLAPMVGSRRGGMGKIKPNNSHSIARSVLRLY